MLNRAQKGELVDQLKTKIDQSNAIFLTNLIGLSANDAVALRKSVREVDGTISVTRNSLFELAAKGTSAEEMLAGLKGPHAVAFAYEDAAAVAKCLKKAGDEHENVVELKAGLLDGKLLSKEELVQLANLPGKDQMLATLLATFNAPIGAFARVLEAIREQKESGAEPAAEATETTEETQES